MSVRIERSSVRAAISISYVPRGRELRSIALLPETVPLPPPPPPLPPLSRFVNSPVISMSFFSQIINLHQRGERTSMYLCLVGVSLNDCWGVRTGCLCCSFHCSRYLKLLTKTYNLFCAFYHLRTKMSCNKSGYCKLGEYRLLIW